MRALRLCLFLFLLCCCCGSFRLRAATLDIIAVPGKALQNNPLNDPVQRRVAVFVPAQFQTNATLPIAYYLPGYGGSSERFIKDSAKWLGFVQKTADTVAPVVFVVVDARTRWGGSQYLNSAAQGNYADYICDEIVPLVERRYHVRPGSTNRIIAGHSSGGFGALRLGNMKPRLFGSVIALSPDSAFEDTHREMMVAPAVAQLPLADVNAFMERTVTIPMPTNGDVTYALGLSAAYAPRGGGHPGEFEWLYDASGHFREETWQRWLDNDPLTIVQKKRDAFLPAQSIYLEGAAQDEYKANIGARKIYDVLRTRPSRCTFYEPPGKHSSHVPERIQRGLAWSLGLPMQEIK